MQNLQRSCKSGDLGKNFSLNSKTVFSQNYFFFREIFFVLLRLLTNYMSLTYIAEENLLYSKSTNRNVNLLGKKKQHIFTETCKIMSDQVAVHHVPVKLTYQINYYTYIPFYFCKLSNNSPSFILKFNNLSSVSFYCSLYTKAS